MEEGIQLFLKERNNMIAGRRVELIIADTGGNPAGAKNKTQELVERIKVSVLIGPLAAFEALWMGVPVVTLLGENMVGRWTASMLRVLGLYDLVARDPRFSGEWTFDASGPDLDASARDFSGHQEVEMPRGKILQPLGAVQERPLGLEHLQHFFLLHQLALLRGVPLVEALGSVAGATGNVVYEAAVLKMRDEVATGQRLQRAMESTDLFPNMVNQMVAVGEESGSLDAMASKVADFYEEEVDNAVDSMSSRPLIGIVHAFEIPGSWSARFISASRSAWLIRSFQNGRSSDSTRRATPVACGARTGWASRCWRPSCSRPRWTVSTAALPA